MTDTNKPSINIGAVESQRDLAKTLVAVLRENPAVCADVSPVHYPWVRFRDGDWQRARRKKFGRIEGGTFDSEQEVVQMFTTQPVTLKLCSEAHRWQEQTLWEHADEQDVFTDYNRCSWCGYSERTRTLGLYETEDDGRQRLCDSCLPTWEDQNLIVKELTE